MYRRQRSLWQRFIRWYDPRKHGTLAEWTFAFALLLVTLALLAFGRAFGLL
jgi:hypothetical protein